MSQNQVDLVFYVEVEGTTRDALEALCEEIDHFTWEYESSKCVLSATLASVDFDQFEIQVLSSLESPADVRHRFMRNLKPHGITIKRTLIAMVPWYNGVDRPVPESLA